MAIDQLTPADVGASARAKINAGLQGVSILALQVAEKADAAAIPNLLTLINAKASAEQVGILIQQIATKAERAAVPILQQQIDRKAPQSQVDILIQQIASKADAASVPILRQLVDLKAPQTQVDILIREMAERARLSDVSAVGDRVTAQRTASVADPTRPGDNPFAFTLLSAVGQIGGPAALLPEIPSSLIVTGDNGAAVRLVAPGVLGVRRRISLESGRAHSVRFVVQRRSDPADPQGHAVRLAIAWLDQANRPLAGTNGFTVVRDSDLRVRDGRQEFATTIARDAGVSALTRAPYGARYAVPYVQKYGDDGPIDVEIIESVDQFGLSVLPDVAAEALTRISALESIDAAAKLAQIQSQLQTPDSLTFPSRGDAAAASIASSVTTLLLRGLTSAGDGFTPVFRRAPASVTPGPDDFTSADGALWTLIPTSLTRDKVMVRDYLPLAFARDGSVNYSARIQAALDAGAGRTVEFPAGIFMATGLLGRSGSHLTSVGRTTLRRPAEDRGFAAVLSFVNAAAFSVTDLICDGNRANQGPNPITADAVLIEGCSDFDLDGLVAINATGCGVVVHGGQDEAAGTNSVLHKCRVRGNGQFGLYLLGAGNVDVEGGRFTDNDLTGVMCDASSVVVHDINFIGITASRNGQSGLYTFGHKDNDPYATNVFSITVTGGQFNSNREWGLVLQGRCLNATGAITRGNGSSNAHAGLLINGNAIQVVNHRSSENYYYGLDIGDARDVNLVGGAFSQNGGHGGGIGVNVEAGQDISIKGVKALDNGDLATGVGHQIYVRGIGGADDASPFLKQTRFVSISGCHIGQARGSSFAGIYVDANADEVTIANDNAYFGFADATLAVILDAERVTVSEMNGDAGVSVPVLQAAPNLIIPDAGTNFLVAGNADISNIFTARQNRWRGRSRRMDVVDGGSGYQQTFSFTLPTGETGKAFVYGGKVVTLLLTGDAAASADFAFDVPGGSGRGAKGRMSSGCNNAARRGPITLQFQGASRFRPGGNIGVPVDLPLETTTAYMLQPRYGNWYRVS